MNLLDAIYNWLSQNPTEIYRKCKERKQSKIFDACNPEFLEWAFSKYHETTSLQTKMNNWNKLHGDLMIVEQVDHMQDALPKMGQFWADHNAKPK